LEEEVKITNGTIVVAALAFGLGSFYTASSANISQQGIPQEGADADALFIKNCASCHGKDGRAKTFKAKFNHARNLTAANWQVAISDEHIYKSILKGKGKMPAFGKRLSEADIAALVSYVRTLKK
jgi:mono/diheme cytochrome c family protein